jgi:hypothetical protein
MKNRLTVARLVIGVGMLTLASVESAEAGPAGPHLNWGSQITPARCPSEDSGYRELVINVTHHVINDADADGSLPLPEPVPPVPVRYWARDDYNRHIQVWEIGIVPGGELFCALVHYQGAWASIAGASPQGTDLIAAGIEGTFHGGYRVAIVGELRPNPPYRTRGNLGRFDYGWSGQPTDAPSSPFDWIATYFASVKEVKYEFIGWIYRGGHNGGWVHACPVSMSPGCTGNQGDITD